MHLVVRAHRDAHHRNDSDVRFDSFARCDHSYALVATLLSARGVIRILH